MFGASNHSNNNSSSSWVKLNPNFHPFLTSSSSSSSSSSSTSSSYYASSSHSLWPLSNTNNDQGPLCRNQYLLPNHGTLTTDNNNHTHTHTNTHTGGLFQETCPPFAMFSSFSSPQPLTAKGQAKRDRHSKICTAQGVRDRRVRLSIGIAREFFDLQDMLGFDKASKTLEWLLTKSKKAIKEVARAKKQQQQQQTRRSGAAYPSGAAAGCHDGTVQEQAAADESNSKESSSDLTNSKEEIPQEEVLNIHQLFREDSRVNAARSTDEERAETEKIYRCACPNGLELHHPQSIRAHSNSGSSSQLVKPSQYQQIPHSPSAPCDDLARRLNSEDESNGFPLLSQYRGIYYNSMIGQQPASFGEPYI